MTEQNEFTPEELAELEKLEAEEQDEKDADKVEAEEASSDEHSGDDLAVDEGQTVDDTEVPEEDPKPLNSDGTVVDEDAATPRDLRKAAESRKASTEEDAEQARRRAAREESSNARDRYLANRNNDLLDSNV